MLSKDVIKKIKHIEIATRRILNGSMVGDSRSAIKGSGFDFDQIREYQLGDDIRFIDWKSSSRMNTLLVKQYTQERNRTIIMAVDVSASGLFSSSSAYKAEIMHQVAAVLALVADYGKDAAGLILFSDELELFIPPGRGRQHVHAIMEKLFSYTPRKKTTRISVALDHLIKLRRSDAVVFLISDFIDNQFSTVEKKLSIVARKYDLIAVRCLDTFEETLPAVGFITMVDSETGQESVIDLRSRNAKKIGAYLDERATAQCSLLKKYGIPTLDVRPERPYMGELIRFFRRRMTY